MGNLIILQGGGATAVFNATLASIIAEAQAQPAIGKVYGARFGMQGLAAGNVMELTSLSSAENHMLRSSPGAGLGSSRFKPSEKDLLLCERVLRSLDIRSIIFMGGNGTMAGAQLFRDFLQSRNFEVQVVGAPKTIDNDIFGTDRCPGFASAARYVAQSTLNLAMDIRSLPQPVSIFETLGRDVGWIAASASLAKTREEDAPHIICVPEVPFVQEQFLDRLDDVVRNLGWAVVVVAEGTSYADGTPVFQQHLPAAAGQAPGRPLIGGVAQYLSGVVAQHLGIRCRSEKPGLIGRSCIAHVSPQDSADAEVTGREAVRALIQGRTDCMVALTSLAHPSRGVTELFPLATAAGPRRALPATWLTGGPEAVSSAFRHFAAPLAGPLQRYDTPLSERR